MSDRSANNRRTTPVWLWALIPMLLAAALVAPLLGRDIFDVDEAATMISACAGYLGPCTPAEAAMASARWPENGWGHAIVFSQWGQLLGWSEFAMRALSWLAGLLTVAWVYRLGRDLFTPTIALAAALLLAGSVFFLTHMHIARFYGPAMLFTSITLWGYWRVALQQRPASQRDRATLLLGATGLLYSLFFGASLIGALGLFHLFLVRKDQRWKQAALLLCLAVLFSLPQAPDLLSGIARNQGREALQARALQATDVLALYLRYQSNDLINLREPAVSLLLLALPLLLLGTSWVRRRRQLQFDAAWYITFTCILSLLMIVGANELTRVFGSERVRYLAPLWPPSALLASLVLLHPGRMLLRPPPGVVLVLAITLFGINDFLQEGPLVRTSWAWRHNDVTMATMQKVLGELSEGEPDSLLIVDRSLLERVRLGEAYFSTHAKNRVRPGGTSTSLELLRNAPGYHDILLLLRNSEMEKLNFQGHLDFFLQRLWVRQRSWSRDGITLVRLASPFLNPRQDQRVLDVDRDIDILGAGKLLDKDTLQVVAHLRSADDYLLSHYSLALHVIDPRTGGRVAQGDVGVGPGSYVMVESEIDVSALPPGNYELHLALYDWRTGERLSARDLQTGTVSDMHVLQRIRIG